MDGPPADDPPAGGGPGASPRRGGDEIGRDLAGDWVTIWQSEMAGLAADRESAEHLRVALAAWFAASAALRAFTSLDPSRSHAAPRSAAASASPDAGDAALRAELAQLERRLAELERRLGERGAEPGRGGRRP